MKLDRIDCKILEILQQEGDISNLDLAKRVALSASPCARRVKQLSDAGFISGYVALLDAKKLGLDLHVILQVGLSTHRAESMRAFEDAVCAMPEVIECHLITGQSADYLLKVMVTDMQAYHQFLLQQLTPIDCVGNVQSSFVLKSVKAQTLLPVRAT